MSFPKVPDGWTVESWIQRLRHLENLAASVNPEQSEFLSQWATELESRTPLLSVELPSRGTPPPPSSGRY